MTRKRADDAEPEDDGRTDQWDQNPDATADIERKLDEVNAAVLKAFGPDEEGDKEL